LSASANGSFSLPRLRCMFQCEYARSEGSRSSTIQRIAGL